MITVKTGLCQCYTIDHGYSPKGYKTLLPRTDWIEPTDQIKSTDGRFTYIIYRQESSSIPGVARICKIDHEGNPVNSFGKSGVCKLNIFDGYRKLQGLYFNDHLYVISDINYLYNTISIFRLDTMGNLDTSFGKSKQGITEIAFSNNYRLTSGYPVISTDNSICYIALDDSKSLHILKVQENGLTDTGWSNKGIRTIKLDQKRSYNKLNKVLKVQNSFYLIQGDWGTLNFVKLKADMTLDSTYDYKRESTVGYYTVFKNYIAGDDLSIENGHIYVSADKLHPSKTYSDFAIIAYKLNNTIDSSFGKNGIVYIVSNTKPTKAKGLIINKGQLLFSVSHDSLSIFQDCISKEFKNEFYNIDQSKLKAILFKNTYCELFSIGETPFMLYDSTFFDKGTGSVWFNNITKLADNKASVQKFSSKNNLPSVLYKHQNNRITISGYPYLTVRIVVFDGREMMSKIIEPGNEYLSIPEFMNEGFYILQVLSNGNFRQQRIVYITD